MREIKFRGKYDKDKWVYGVPVLNGNGQLFMVEGMVGGWDIDPDTVGQFTGRHDTNEKEVYEGDIISFTVFDHNDHDTQYEGVVTFADGRWMLWNTKDSEYYGF